MLPLYAAARKQFKSTKTTAAMSSPQPSDADPPHKRPSLWQRIQLALGFQKRYNFNLFSISAGAMLLFSLLSTPLLNLPRNFPTATAPGAWYWYQSGHRRVGLTLHIFGVVPLGLLMIWQFIPAIRRKFRRFHRVNGYVVMGLAGVSNVGGLMICRRSFGGGLDIQAACGVLAIATTGGMYLAWDAIRHGRVRQHRAWMLRTMFYLGTVITIRVIVFVAAVIVSRIDEYDAIMTCGEINWIMRQYGDVPEIYPQCVGGKGDETLVIVHATFANARAEEIAAALRVVFGMSMWLGIFLHAAGVEIYLALTSEDDKGQSGLTESEAVAKSGVTDDDPSIGLGSCGGIGYGSCQHGTAGKALVLVREDGVAS